MKLSAGTARPSSFTVLASVVKNEGFTTLYNGLSAGLLRQATYTTTRLGNNKQILLHPMFLLLHRMNTLLKNCEQ